LTIFNSSLKLVPVLGLRTFNSNFGSGLFDRLGTGFLGSSGFFGLSVFFKVGEVGSCLPVGCGFTGLGAVGRCGVEFPIKLLLFDVDFSRSSCLCFDAVFYRTYPLLYRKFENMVILHFVAQETRIITKLFIFKKGRNRRSKFDNQKYISLFISRFINN